jgi:hypothetical protein
MKTRIHQIMILATLLAAAVPVTAQKFYADDPVSAEPPPLQVNEANYRSLNELWELFTNLVQTTGERHPDNGVIPAQGVNTMGDVLDGAWFVHRHSRRRMTQEELMRGPGGRNKPSTEEPLRVLTVRKYDVRPGLLVADAKNTVYLLRFDPPRNPEMSTGAGMIGTRLMYALGYWTGESHIINFQRSQLVASPEGEDITAVGTAKDLMEEDIDLFLDTVHKDRQGNYRALAITVPKNAELIGPYQFYGSRSDDPNDIVAHEHRRDQRGLHVISAWLANNWISPTQTVDVLLEENGTTFIRHYFVDFFTSLGSGFQEVKHAREGNEPLLDLRQSMKNFAGFGIYAPKWQRASYRRQRSAGLYEYEVFDPAKWVSNYDVAPLANHLPDDDYWAAKLIMSLTDDDLRAIVSTAEYSDQRTADWIAECLGKRRDKIGAYFLDRVLPVDNFTIRDGKLAFDDLAADYGFRPRGEYTAEWTAFDNFARTHARLGVETTLEIPERFDDAKTGSYIAARIRGSEADKTTTVYFRKEAAGISIAGVDRDWPGKVIAEEQQPDEALISRYAELEPRPKKLFDSFVTEYNRKTGFGLTPEQAYLTLSMSERTTFDAITHALSSSKLSDGAGNDLGVALDLITGVERIAGQYYGRQGDEMFRLYCFLREDAREVIEKSTQFARSHDNTVYHAGYPTSYRQEGKVPNIQFSMSEDGLKADVDVDYRASKIPQAVWNGHLTASNSDVRAGNNYDNHNKRWSGLINWWTKLFGELGPAEKEDNDMLAQEPPEESTPLPADRPANARVENAYEANQEFLTDWLVRQKYDEALAWVSDESMACVNLDDDAQQESLTSLQTRQQLRKNMAAISEEMGEFESLTEAIDVVIPWRKAFRVMKQPFEGDFSMVEVPDSFARAFSCEVRDREAEDKALAAGNFQYGNYYASMFRFKVANNRGGVLGVMWKREDGDWRIVSWEVFEP